MGLVANNQPHGVRRMIRARSRKRKVHPKNRVIPDKNKKNRKKQEEGDVTEVVKGEVEGESGVASRVLVTLRQGEETLEERDGL